MKKELFDLTNDQTVASKTIYGKVIKCLIAPHHSYSELEKIIPYDSNTFLFPEREMTNEQCRMFINVLSKKGTDEFRVVTTNMNIICDMIDSSVRILTESGNIVDCPQKTFAANIHDIRYNILESDKYKDGKSKGVESENNMSYDYINIIIDKLNNQNQFTKSEYEQISKDIDSIGEDVIRGPLKNMLRGVKVV